MSYTKAEIERISEAVESIESAKPHDHAAPTYREAPWLSELQSIALSHIDDRDDAEDTALIARFLAREYEKMGRLRLSMEWYKRLILLYAISPLGSIADMADDYYSALRAQNYYEPNPCEELCSAAKNFLPDDVREKAESETLSKRAGLRRDPVELTDEYLAAIDEVEKAIDDMGGSVMHGFERDSLKQRLLKERGIEWQTLRRLNPKVRFD